MNRIKKHLLRHGLLFVFLAGSAAAQQMKPGVVEGAIVGLGTSDPISGAAVQLKPLNAPETYVVQSTGTGRFEFRNIPPGQYTLSATSSGFVRSEYGKRRATDPELPLTIESGRTVTDVRLIMVQSGAIAGHAIDSRGEPVAAAAVRAFEHAYIHGQRALRIVQTVTTDDLGNFRLFSLSPGRYFVSASIASENASAPTFYPETSDVRNAGAIDVFAGSTVSGITIRVLSQPRRHIRGTVRISKAGEDTANVQLTPQIPILNASPISSIVDRGTGKFDIAGVAPGAYTLTAMSGTLSMQNAMDVENANVDGVEITIPTPVEIPVRVALDSATDEHSRIEVSEIAFDLRRDPQPPGLSAASYMSNASIPGGGAGFTMQVAPGDYRIVAQSIPANAYIQSIRLGTLDVLNDGLHVDANFNGHLEITIGSNPGSLEGNVTTGRQRPASNTIAILAPDASHRQRLELFQSARTDASGRFDMKNIPPGDYIAFSWDDVEPFSWMNPDFMRTYEDKGTPIHVGPGSRQIVSITVIPAP